MEARRKATVREGQAGPGRRRRWWLLALPLALLLGAWLSVPAWGPHVAGYYLPEGWSLGEVKLSVPGLRRTGVPHATAQVRLPGMQLELRGEGAVVTYADPSVAIERLIVTVELDAPEAGPPSGPWSPEDLALPRLVLPGGFPRATIGVLDLTLVSGSQTQSWQFRDLVFDGSASEAELALTIDEPPFLAEPLVLSLVVVPERLVLEASVSDEPSPLVRYEQRAPAADGTGTGQPSATAEVWLDLDLAGIDLVALAPRLEAAALPIPTDARGRLSLQASLAGDERLLPQSAEVQANGVTLDLTDGRLTAAFEASVDRGDTGWDLALTRGSFSAEGALATLREALGETLAEAGIDLPLAGNLALAIDLDGALPSDTALTAWVSHATPHRATATARVSIDGSLDETTRLALALDELALTADDLTRPAAYGLAAALDATLSLNTPLALRTEPLILGVTGADLRLNGQLTRPAGGAPAFQGALSEARLAAFSLAHPANTVRLDTLTLEGELDASPDGFAWAGQAGGTRLITAPGDAVAANSLMTADAVSFRGQATGPPDALTVVGKGRLDGVLLPDLAVTLDGVTIDLVRLDLPAVDAELGALTTGLEATLDDTVHSGLDLDVTATLSNGEALAGEGELLLGFSGALPFRFDARLDTAEATVSLDQAALPAAAFADAARAAAVSLPEDLTFTGGDLVFDGSLSVGPPGLGGAVDLRGDDLAFRFGESRFEGLEFATRVSVADAISGDGPLLLELAQLAAGLDLLSVSTSLAFSGTDVGLLDLDAQLLGGTLSSPSLRVTAGDLADSVIRWDGFDLGLLLTFLDVDGLEGEGTLDATVPLASEGGQPGIDGARFAARGPGLLRYSTGGPATNIGLQALENFEYDSLEGTLDYAPNGDYTISMDLLGKNPDLYGGHPIRFRLNLGGAMPALFRSLFVTGNFEEAIIERLRAGEPFLEEEAGVDTGVDGAGAEDGPGDSSGNNTEDGPGDDETPPP